MTIILGGQGKFHRGKIDSVGRAVFPASKPRLMCTAPKNTEDLEKNRTDNGNDFQWINSPRGPIINWKSPSNLLRGEVGGGGVRAKKYFFKKSVYLLTGWREGRAAQGNAWALINEVLTSDV